MEVGERVVLVAVCAEAVGAPEARAGDAQVDEWVEEEVVGEDAQKAGLDLEEL